ncbi:MAG: type II toxin-antitoxin system RelE/ParE family toxin [Magnetococcales bacterium]|nr:type II toxin-antitoxin system RelE/ParE family toxin [Magnetococcales bacterium]
MCSYCHPRPRFKHSRFPLSREPRMQRVRMRLDRIDADTTLDDLRIPPSHHLEALQGDRLKQHSIRINDQWRICFVLSDSNAQEVEIVDYH